MIIPTEQEKIEIINCLKELDCCSRCIIRCLGVKREAANAYEQPENYLNFLCEDFISDTYSNLLSKRVRRNLCRICLGIFQDAIIEKFTESISSTNIEDYKYSDYATKVSFPKAVVIRNRSIFIYLKEKFPHIYNDRTNMENLSTVFRTSAANITSLKIKKAHNHSSHLSLLFEIEYEDDEMEIRNIENLGRVIKCHRQDLSKNYIGLILEKCEDKLFKEQFPVPPEIPNKEPVAHIQCMAESMWLGGRYLKFSRNMGQTPWNVDNIPVVQHCLQDILFESIEKVLGCTQKQLTFSASGREDADVRMLGNGRPFYIQIEDPKDRSITFEQLRSIEREILKSKLAAVIKLQVCYKDDLKCIKDGEEFKRKHYYALCHTNAANMDAVINIINNYVAPLEIYQKTPIRVLHRRTQAVRKKNIYSMEAKMVPGHSDFFELKVITQAGTYVKEFVHGDLDRTRPSITSIIQQPVDVVALDVTRVELNWPPDTN